MMTTDDNDTGSVTEEIETLRQTFPRVKIQSAITSFLTGSYERTPYTRIKVTLTFPPSYPSRPLIVNVASDNVVPPGLKKKLERELGKVASDLQGTHEQVVAVFGRLVNFVDTNKFVPCWKELRQSVDLVQKQHGSTVSIHDVKGLIRLRLKHGQYYYACSIFIDDGYPTTIKHEDYGMPCRLRVDSTNFPPKIESILSTQARELVRRMQDGMPSNEALKMSNPVRAPKGMMQDNGKKDAARVRLTQDALKALKKDTETLKYVKDLRNINAATTRGNAHVKAHKAKERKDARRAIDKITQQEIAKDEALQVKEQQWQLEEKARIAGYNFTEYDGTNPQPSLLSLVTFLIDKIQRLPEETCPICSELSLLEDPTQLLELYASSSSDNKTDMEKRARREARRKRPVRTFCGCWYHYNCLDKFMTEPPFGAACPRCQRRVYHPDWPSDIRELERAWANKEARKREIEDAAMFL